MDLCESSYFLFCNQVLTQRCGSAVILALIYSEVLKMLRLWGVIDFDVEIYYPHNPLGLPRAYDKKKSKESDQQHIMTSESLLVEVASLLSLVLSSLPS